MTKKNLNVEFEQKHLIKDKNQNYKIEFLATPSLQALFVNNEHTSFIDTDTIINDH